MTITEHYMTPLELLGRLAQLITPSRIHKHRYCGVLAPNARLRQADPSHTDHPVSDRIRDKPTALVASGSLPFTQSVDTIDVQKSLTHSMIRP